MQLAFEGKIMYTQYCIKNKRLDAYLLKYKVGIQIYEYDHKGRDPKYEQRKQLMIEDHWIVVIRTNSDAPDFNINRLINRRYMHIKQSTEKSLIDDVSKRLLELEFKSDHSIKSKCWKLLVKKILPRHEKDMKNTQSRIETIKAGKNLKQRIV